MKLFNKTIDRQLFKQYSLGSDLSKQEVVVKIFNPMGAQNWFILNSDPEDPDYLWAIVDLGYGAEIGSVSRSDLETYRGKFGLGFERDLSFDPINAEELYKGLRQGKYYAKGGGVDDYSDLYGQEVMALKNAKTQAKKTGYDYLIYLNKEGEISLARKNEFERFFDKNDCEILYSIDEKGNVTKVKYYADGGNLSRDQKFLNHSEAYEMQYAKGKNRKSYEKHSFAEGGNLRQSLEEVLKKDVTFLKFDSGRAYEKFSRLDIAFINVHDYDFNHYCIIKTENLEKVLDNVSKGVKVVKKKFSSDDLGFDYKGNTSFAEGGLFQTLSIQKQEERQKLKENIIKALFVDKKNPITEVALTYSNSEYSVPNINKQDIRNMVLEINKTKKYKNIIIYTNSYGVLSLKVENNFANGGKISGDEVTLTKGYGYYDLSKYAYGNDFKRFVEPLSGKFTKGTIKIGGQIRVLLDDGREIITDKQAIDLPTYDEKDELYQQNKHLFSFGYANGGNLENFSDNQRMIMNQNIELENHHEELEDILEDKVAVPAWVVAKMATATDSISDVTHYLDGQKELMEGEDEEDEEENEEQNEDQEEVENKEVVEPINVSAGTKAELTKKFTDDALGNLKGFLKGMEGIDLRDDYTFDYKNEQFEVEPIINSDNNGVSNAVFTIFDGDGEEVGEVAYSREGGKQKFTANSEFFRWNNTKFEDGGFMNGVYADGGYFDGTIPKVSTYMSNYADGGEVENYRTLSFKTKAIAEKNKKDIESYFGERFLNSNISRGIDERGSDGFFVEYSLKKENYAKGGEVAKAEVFELKRNIMGTTDIEMKISGMRKAQDFVVYPIGKDDAGNVITIQSDTRIGQINLVKGFGVMSQSHSNGAYFVHLQMDKLTSFTISESDLANIKSHIFKTAGANVGTRNIVSDNSGASRIYAKGGSLEDRLINLENKKSDLESKLFEAKLVENEKWNNLGWGAGMRLSKISISNTKTDSLKERIKVIEKEIEQTKNDMLPKKPKYIDHSEIKTVTVKRNGKEVTYKGEDVLNGANILAEGGDLSSKANYIPKRDVVGVELKNGTTIKPANGYWVKKGAEPIGTEPTPTSSSKSQSKISTIEIRKDPRGNWRAETTIDDFNGYDWRLTTLKTYSGQLISSAQGGKFQDSGTKGISMFKYTMYEDPYHTLEASKPTRLTEKVVAEQHEKALAKFKKYMETGMFKGGGQVSNFDKLSAKVAKQYEGKPVKSKYQEEYGKYYSKEEAQEVGDKVAGKVKAMQTDSKAFGGLFSTAKKLVAPEPNYPKLEGKQVALKSGELVQVFTQAGSMLSVLEVGKMGSGQRPYTIDISEVDSTSFKMGGSIGNKKTNSGAETLKKANDLAKEIRKEGESWLDAKRRAFAQLKK